MQVANHLGILSDPDANASSPLLPDSGPYLSVSLGCTGKCATPVGVRKGVGVFMRLGKLKRPAEGKGRIGQPNHSGKY